MTRIAVIGSQGQLGTDLVSVLRRADGYEVTELGHPNVEVTNAASVHAALTQARPAVVVNCAAYVRVDDSEDDPARAFGINALGALHVARTCRTLTALCVYVSTDYVFDGRKGAPYTEDDVPCPINVYGTSKLTGEFLVRQAAGDWLIVRSASLYGHTTSRGKGGNFVETILARARAGDLLRVVDDVRMSPTYAADLALGIERLLRDGMRGVVHLTNAGSATWYEFARTVVNGAGLQADIHPVTSQEYPTKARRPADSSLRSRSGQPALRSWQDALRDYLGSQDHMRVEEVRWRRGLDS